MYNLNEIFQRQKAHFKVTKYNANKIISKLVKLKIALKRFDQEFYDALKKDFNRTKEQSYYFEIVHVLNEINYFIKNIRKISKTKRIKNNFKQFFSSKNYLCNKAYGSVLVISSYYQPVMMSLIPLIGSFASGNNTIIKLSPYSGNTNDVIEKLVSTVFSSSEAFVINDRKNNLSSLFGFNFDFVFFSGSEIDGKNVHLNFSSKSIPTYINTSSKCPAIINDFKNIKKDIKKIVWGKLLNAGQSNILPSYFLINSKIYDQFVESLINEINQQHPIDEIDYSLPCIIGNAQYDKIIESLRHQTILYERKNKPKLRKIYPTIIEINSENNLIMHEEIFGPIFVLIKYDSISEINSWISMNRDPIAIYCFSKNKNIIDEIKLSYKTSFFVVNDIFIQLFKHLPFSSYKYSSESSFRFLNSYSLFTYKTSIVYSKRSFKELFPPYNNFSFMKIKNRF